MQLGEVLKCFLGEGELTVSTYFIVGLGLYDESGQLIPLFCHCFTRSIARNGARYFQSAFFRSS
jgi:hypothetical protein